MNYRGTMVEAALNRVEFHWKWLRLLRRASMLGIGLCLGFCAVAYGIRSGALTDRSVAIGVWAALGLAGSVSLCVVAIRILAGGVERRWLGAALERIDRRWLDRLNTLLFLEHQPAEPHTQAFARRIASQAQAVAADVPGPLPFAARNSLLWLVGFFIVLGLTLQYYRTVAPWARLATIDSARHPRTASTTQVAELALPTNSVETDPLWGEVRITEPGSDLQVTKVDVVPLQIEAASSQNFQNIGWFSAINGGDEVPHALPAPSEPRFAVYRPTVFLEDLNLSDWDVMTYYAKASTEKNGSYASQVYFLEVRPFREDVQKLPGGENGQAYGTLNQLTSLINHQQHVIRQTYQHIEKPPAQPNVQKQDRGKLAAAEADLGASTEHLHAQLAAQSKDEPVGDALDNLSKAQDSLQAASQHLAADELHETPNLERRALSQLVAARKLFGKAVSDHPEAFQRKQQAEPDPGQQLNQMAEFNNEARAAQEFVDKTLQDQRRLQQDAQAAARDNYPSLGNRQEDLQKQLQNFQSQHPEPFKGAEKESNRAQQSMNGAAQALQQGSSQAPDSTGQATQALGQFSQALQQRTAQQQLADAYRLKQMLDQQIRTLDQRAQTNAQMSDEQLQKTAREARDTVKQLSDAAEQDPTRNAFGKPLHEALSGQNRMDLEVKLRQLQQAQSDAEKQQGSAAARDKLQQLSDAFDNSQPESMRMARQNDALKPDQQGSFAQGLSEMQSLLQRLQGKGSVSRGDQVKQGQQALANLQQGIQNRLGKDPQGRELLQQLEKLLANPDGVNPADLKSLLGQLQRFSQESSTALAEQQGQPGLMHIDPARLPPAYRGRIQRYFEKLSEQ